MDSEKIIEKFGGPSELARLCECTPQAVSQWSGTDPDTGVQREIPNARLLYLKAIRPDIFETDPAVSTVQAAHHRTEPVAV
jgi:hypothetical protein